MSRSLKGFIAFCAAIAVGLVIAAVWIGPRTLSLTFDESQRTRPLYVLHFARFAPAHAPGYRSEYLQAMRRLVEAEGGAQLWHGELVPIAQGRLRDEWQALGLFRFQAASEFVRAVTGSEFRGLPQPKPGFQRFVAVSQTAPEKELGDYGALAVLLIETNPDEPLAVAALTTNLSVYDGEVAWQAPISVLELGMPAGWNRVLAIGFADVRQAELWLADLTSLTERAIVGARYQALATLLLRRG